MEEYFKRSDSFLKRLKGSKIPKKEEKYLLFRMGGPIMQARLPKIIDLSRVPITFLHGNPHIDNYARTMRGSAMLDFDRSRMGPYCWDIIRFLSALSLRREDEKGFLDRIVVEHFIDGYYVHFINPEIPAKQLKMLKQVKPEDWQLSTKNYLQANKRWAKKMRDFKIDPKTDRARGLLDEYLKSRGEQYLMEQYNLSEVGECPGSFGKIHYIFSLTPKNPDSHLDSIILDIKQVYAEKDTKYFTNPYPHHGQRMIEASKVFADGFEERLGFCTYKGEQYWGRQVPCFGIKVKKFLNKAEQCDFAYSVGSELGKGHRKGLKDPAAAADLEKDFQANFDKYLRIARFYTEELNLAFETMLELQKLQESLRG